MKKIKLLAGALAVVTCLSFCNTVNVKAADEKTDVKEVINTISKADNSKSAVSSDYSYYVNSDNTATIDYYIGDDSFVHIPDTIDGHTVTRIGEGAFKNRSFIGGVNIPSSVNEINDNAFAYDENLLFILINNSNAKVSDTAFLCNSMSNEKRVIFGYSDSTAKTYAYKNKFVFYAMLDSEDAATVDYDTYVQKLGWISQLKNIDGEDAGYASLGEAGGSMGLGLRMEAFRAKIDGNDNLGIKYSAHVQKQGWQDYVSDDQVAGTTGKALRVEALKMELTGADKDKYDLYYRAHVQSFGWLGWAKNGEAAGSVGLAKRVEAMEVVLVKKGSNAPGVTDGALKEKEVGVQYRTHVQSFGWQNFVEDGALSGTVGQAKRLEGINIKLANQKLSGNIEYRTHVQKIGWQDYVKNGAMAGTEGRALRLEAIQIRLTDEMAKNYDVYYRVQIQKKGWLGWAKNDELSGSSGLALRLEGIQIKLVKKGEAAPSSDVTTAYVTK